MTNFTPQLGFQGISTPTGATPPAPTFAFNPLDQLKSLGADVPSLDQAIEARIEEQKAKTIQVDDFYNIVDNAIASGEFDDLSEEDVYYGLMQAYKDDGYIINGIDIEEELKPQEGVTDAEINESISNYPLRPGETRDNRITNLMVEKGLLPESELEVFPQEEEPGALKSSLQWTQRNVLEAPGRTVGAGIAQLPDIVGNVGGFFIGKPIDFALEKAGIDAPSLEEQFKKDGIQNKEQLQEILGIDPDDWTTTVGEFGAEIGSLATPTGIGRGSAYLSSKVAAKFPQAAEKINQGVQGLYNLSKKAPATFKTIMKGLSPYTKALVKGATEFGKFEIVSKGDLELQDLGVGAAAGVVLKGVSRALQGPTGQKAIKSINDRFAKLATKLSPSTTTKAMLDKEIKKGTEGAFIIREANKDLKLVGDEAISNSLVASRNTRQKLLKEMSAEKGVGGIDLTPTIKWIDDMKLALTQRGYQKKLTKDAKIQFNELAKMDSDVVVKTLDKLKKELLSPAKSKGGKMSLANLDDQIIFNNNQLGPLFTRATGISEKQALQVRAAVNNNMIKLLDKGVQGSGVKFRALKDAYGKVRTFENNLDKIYAQVLRKKDAQLGDFADVFIGSNFATSFVAGDIAGIGKAALQKGLKEYIKKQNDANYVLGKMFNLIDKELKIPASTISGKAKRTIQTGAGKVEEFLDIGKGTGGKVKEGFKKAGSAESAIKQTKDKAKDKFDLSFLKKATKIGEGTGREVYDIGYGKVLKVAKNRRGLDQNKGALVKEIQDAGIVPKVHEVGKDYVVMDKVRPFNKLTTTEQKLVNNLSDDVQNLVRQEADIDKVRKVLKKYDWDKLADLDIKTFGWGDVVKKNLSVVNGKPVLLDEGTIGLVKTQNRYKRRVALKATAIGAGGALATEIDSDTLYDIFGYLIGGDILKKNTPEENKKIFNK